MLLKNFNKKNIIFVHVPKTGGGTIENMILQHYFQGRDVDIVFERKKIHSLNKTWTQHHTIHDIIKSRGVYRPEDYYKFAFVRNPWDRAVSEYFYIKNHGGCACRGNIRKIPKSFEDYILNNFKCSWRNHIEEQYNFIYDKYNKQCVDYIGRFEDFTGSVQKIFNILKIYDANIPNINQSRNLKQKILKPYWFFYNNKTRSIIEEIYARDIEAFNYKFEG